ncbi:hypothetical protein [Deinococcus roseus]|uniref:Uncharacterized protein n=1 Tax=Deinococcus roseus TaxID=392414 RepID=A0ABQ2DEM1_9DEIO|nr:hypothetical protein [Deinococcus roseus]GGJ53043.1 hypothetical protein GCM10008938_43780 [Deinococcus roseus]
MEALVMLGFFGCLTLVSFVLSAREDSDPDAETPVLTANAQ